MRGRALLCMAVLAAFAVPAALAAAPLTQENIATVGVALKVPTGWGAGQLTSKLKSAHVVAVYRSPKTISSFHANLNVIQTSFPSGYTLREWLLGTESAKYLAIGTLKTVSVDGVTGLAYTSSKLESTPDGHPLVTAEYAFEHGGKGYLFTYTALASTPSATGVTLFKSSAMTIKFVVTPPSG
ncbi:MAG TPA: hypothetical protein VGM80_14470 [Gaiellaceae bacterium]